MTEYKISEDPAVQELEASLNKTLSVARREALKPVPLTDSE